jgi:hypothetical protein
MLLTLSSSIELVFLLLSGPSCNTSTTQPIMLAGAADPILELSSPIAFASVLLRFFSASFHLPILDVVVVEDGLDLLVGGV